MLHQRNSSRLQVRPHPAIDTRDAGDRLPLHLQQPVVHTAVRGHHRITGRVSGRTRAARIGDPQ